jgi:hypothetical protein
MYHLLHGSSVRIMMVSFFVYLFVNLFENLFHYNIGKFSNREIDFSKNLIPTNRDWVKIIMVMVTFALIHGLLTCFFRERCF